MGFSLKPWGKNSSAISRGRTSTKTAGGSNEDRTSAFQVWTSQSCWARPGWIGGSLQRTSKSDRRGGAESCQVHRNRKTPAVPLRVQLRSSKRKGDMVIMMNREFILVFFNDKCHSRLSCPSLSVTVIVQTSPSSCPYMISPLRRFTPNYSTAYHDILFKSSSL